MKPLSRVVAPEWLDALPADDPRALRSRGDLRRLNRIMNHAAWLRRALAAHWPAAADPARPVRIAELGAGDGTLLLRVARRAASPERPATVRLVDRQSVASPAAMQRFAATGWPAEAVVEDAFDWLSREGSNVDIMVCNLFLHHFDSPRLGELLGLIARRAGLLVACEPARTRLAMTGSGLLGLIGCNDVTRHDALASVAAGFRGDELSTLWPRQAGWRLEEGRAGLFSHGFVAIRQAGGRAPGGNERVPDRERGLLRGDIRVPNEESRMPCGDSSP